MSTFIEEMQREKKRGYMAKYNASHPWAKYVNWARCRSKVKNRVFTLNTAQAKALWIRDNASNFKKASLDRIDNNKGYTFENCRFIEWIENCRQGGLMAGKSVTKIEPNGQRTNYSSLKEAGLHNGITDSAVLNIIKGRSKRDRRGNTYEYIH